MRPEVAIDFDWQRRFIPELKRICGEHLISEAPPEEDMERNTDLVVLRLEAVRVACRVRRHSYYPRYASEFTLRSGRPSGVMTELEKVLRGWGDYMIYGFAAADEATLCCWTLGDLNSFRGWFQSELYERPARDAPGRLRENHDRSSWFHVFRITDIPGFVKAQYDAGKVAA